MPKKEGLIFNYVSIVPGYQGRMQLFEKGEKLINGPEMGEGGGMELSGPKMPKTGPKIKENEETVPLPL